MIPVSCQHAEWLDGRDTFDVASKKLDLYGNRADIMNKSQAKTYLCQYVDSSFRSTKPCRQRMKERNVTIDDILNVIFWGKVVELEDDGPGRWKCTVKGLDIEGDELVFVVAMDENENSVLCITVF